MPVEAVPVGDDRLESWKEIASYLGREVRRVQLWEKSEGLPVHRLVHARQGSVYAFKSELDRWREARKNSPRFRKREWRIAGATTALLLMALGGLALLRNRAVMNEVPSSIAVLPFLDLSPQKDSEYFSDGLTEELIDALSRVPNLRVVARTSCFAFKGQNGDIREIGRKLNVNVVLEGSVRKSGDRLRITAQLNRVTDGYHLWSRTYDRELRDVFAVQHEISEAIVNQLRAGPARQSVVRELTRDTQAYQLYQEGRYLFNKFQYPESNDKAIRRYRDAIARDPNFAAAWAGLADAYACLAENAVAAPREVMPKAREAAEKALELDDSSSEAHTSLGIVKLDFDRDVEGGQREFLRAMQLNPGFGWARHWYAHSLEAQNRVEDALAEMRASLVLDPLSIPINWDIAGELIILGRYDEALRNIENAAEEARDGDIAHARATLARLEEMRRTRYVDPFPVLFACKVLTDRQLLFLWLRRADEERSSFFVYLHPYAPYWGLDRQDIAEFEKQRRR